MEAKPPKDWVRIGCGGILATLLVVGLAKFGLEKLGYLPSEAALRQGAQLTIADVVVEGQQVLVRLALTNRSKWAMSAGVSCTVVDASGKIVATQTIELLGVAPDERLERDAKFDLETLQAAGLDKVSAKNFQLSCRWVCEAGREANLLFR